MHIQITGPAACGKTTLANEMKKFLEQSGRKVLILDEEEKLQVGHKPFTNDVWEQPDVIIQTCCQSQDILHSAPHIYAFLNDDCIFHATGKVDANTLYQHYHVWSMDHDHPTASKSAFTRALATDHRIVRVKGESLNYYKGITLKDAG